MNKPNRDFKSKICTENSLNVSDYNRKIEEYEELVKKYLTIFKDGSLKTGIRKKRDPNRGCTKGRGVTKGDCHKKNSSYSEKLCNTEPCPVFNTVKKIRICNPKKRKIKMPANSPARVNSIQDLNAHDELQSPIEEMDRITNITLLNDLASTEIDNQFNLITNINQSEEAFIHGSAESRSLVHKDNSEDTEDLIPKLSNSINSDSIQHSKTNLNPISNLKSITSINDSIAQETHINLKFADLQFIKNISKGFNSSIDLYSHKHTKASYTVKTFSKSNIKTKQSMSNLRNEIQISSLLDHPNIISFKLSHETKDKVSR